MTTHHPNDPRPVTTVLPTAVVKPARRISVIWVVPVVAAALAAFLIVRTMREAGPEIVIRFKDGSGLKRDQATIKYHGITVGDVQSVRLAPDHQGVDVKVRLDRNAEFLACEGSVFWIVRPEITMEGVRGLGTILSGSHIEVNPGSGKQKREFVGAEKSPGTSREGLKLVLMAGSLGFVKPTSAVLYRGIEVGEVEKVDLSADSRTVDIHVLIHEPYARLVRPETRFWNAGGVDFNFGLFSGLEVSAETFKSLVAGGIAFATPESITSNTVSNGMLYRLHDRPEESWLKWSPSIELPGP